MNAIILSIGDELVLGQTVDTNSAWLSQQLAAAGCEITKHVTVPDHQEQIEWAIRNARGTCDFLVISGGIGPTEDDLTRQALAAVMGVGLHLNESWLAKLHEFFKARGREMPETNKIQAMIPRNAKMIENTCGTAAGIDAMMPNDEETVRQLKELEKISQLLPERSDTPKKNPVSDEYMERMFGKQYLLRKKHAEILLQVANADRGDNRSEALFALLRIKKPMHVFVMPGVPKEMKAMFTRDVLPHIQAATGGAVILSRTLHTFGLGESWIAEKLGDLMKRDRNPSVGTTVANGIVSLRINARFDSRGLAQQNLEDTVRTCHATLGDLIFGEEEQTLPQIVGASLASSRKTVTTAESCTGGLLAKMLTDISGSSEYFKTGFVTYSNEAKTELLNVDPTHIEGHGAVSDAVAREMAIGAIKRTGADFALSITGIAGPGGGTAQKPVGTVCIALASKTDHAPKVNARTFNFPGDREMIRDRSAKMALSMLRYHLLGKPLPF